MKTCELCKFPAKAYCESDQASLCWGCDAKVHAANFLVARHYRSLLCNNCQSPTPWRASGAKLCNTVSVCESCANCDRDEEEEEEESEGANDYEAEEEEEEEEEEDEDEGENQVVPWTSTTPPPAASSSSSEESSVSGSSSLKRMRDQDDVCCSFSRRKLNRTGSETTSVDSFKLPLKDRRTELDRPTYVQSGSTSQRYDQRHRDSGKLTGESEALDLNSLPSASL